jgi:hypothetical protein
MAWKFFTNFESQRFSMNVSRVLINTDISGSQYDSLYNPDILNPGFTWTPTPDQSEYVGAFGFDLPSMEGEATITLTIGFGEFDRDLYIAELHRYPESQFWSYGDFNTEYIPRYYGTTPAPALSPVATCFYRRFVTQKPPFRGLLAFDCLSLA